MNKFNLTVKLQVEVEAPTEFDAFESVADVFGDGWGVVVKEMDVKRTPTPRKKN